MKPHCSYNVKKHLKYTTQNFVADNVFYLPATLGAYQLQHWEGKKKKKLKQHPKKDLEARFCW